METADRNRIAGAAITHAVYRRTARVILRKVHPKCLVIGNANRPLEFSLWAEAKAQDIATVLLPFAEINLKPARFLSLCRGDFDLVLPFSEYSASELRKLNPNVAIEVVGFPSGSHAIDADDVSKAEKQRVPEVLYIGGNNFEEEASAIIRKAFAGYHDLRFRVRPHPRNRGAEIRKLFGWLAEERFSDPLRTSLAEDIANADVMIMVRSTVALDAMCVGVPMVWLSPPMHREELERHPIRKQELALLDVSTPGELLATVRRLLEDEAERKRVIVEQWARLRAAGYRRDYFEAVKSVLRRFVGTIG